MKIRVLVSEGLLWWGTEKKLCNMMLTSDADRIAYASGLSCVEKLMQKYPEGTVLTINKDFKIV